MSKTEIRTYKGQSALKKGIRRMEKQGWSVLSVVEEPQGMVGRWASFYAGKPYLVTFQQEG